MHKAVSLSKNAARSKGLAAKATLFVYKPFYLKAILSETPRSSPTKYPLHWLVSLAASEIPILSQCHLWFGPQHAKDSLGPASCPGMWFPFPGPSKNPSIGPEKWICLEKMAKKKVSWSSWRQGRNVAGVRAWADCWCETWVGEE